MPLDNDTFAAILSDISSGDPAYKATEAHGVTVKAFWAHLQDETAGKEYARASLAGWERMAHDCETIADDPSIPSDQKRIMVDTRKWLLSKRLPKKYGDHLELGGDKDSPVSIIISPTQAKL